MLIDAGYLVTATRCWPRCGSWATKPVTYAGSCSLTRTSTIWLRDWFAKTHGTPVYCHADEVGHAKREYLERASPLDVALRIWRPRWAKWART